MLRINQLKLEPGHSEQELKEKILHVLRIKPEELLEYHIFKRSIDARKKPDVYYSYTIDFHAKEERRILQKCKSRVQPVSVVKYQVPAHGKLPMSMRPVIVGAGPAGLFCTYLLAREGYRPILLERGAAVEERLKDVEQFWQTGVLNPASNVQFGEGGAGTFSDGKLNTTVKEQYGRNRFVLDTFVRFGASEQILYEQKPHIGTDILTDVVCNMRKEILALGGEVRFHSQVTDMEEELTEAGKVIKSVTVNKTDKLYTRILVLAIGHSARDTFQMLSEHQIPMEAKAFAVGVRVEHPQEMIQYSQYGAEAAGKLPPASYKLTHNLEDGRGIYTFCMCPGGFVVNASSEEGRLAVNGMSYSSRNGENANSAVVVTVTPKDYGTDNALSGMEFQRRLEEKAYQIGQGKIPVQCFADFCADRCTKELGEITPQTRGGYQFANVRSIFPEELAGALQQGIVAMDKKIQGFARPDAVLSGVESRTSSPVRLIRNDFLECELKGVYPCGEGAGYAGGITSAAMDGMKVAESIISQYAPADIQI